MVKSRFREVQGKSPVELFLTDSCHGDLSVACNDALRLGR